MGRTTATTNPAGGVATSVYNAAGLSVGSLDEAGHRTSIIYDSYYRGLVAQVIEAVGSDVQASTIKSYDADGRLTKDEMSELLEITPQTVGYWRRAGLLQAHAYNDKNEYLYEPVGASGPRKAQGIKYTDPRRLPEIASDKTKGVQDEA